MNHPPRQTQVDPKGLAKLYLRTSEISDYFQAYLNYYQYLAQRNKRRFWSWLAGYLLSALLLLNWLTGELDFSDDDEGVIIIMVGVGLIVGLFILIGIFNSRKGKLRQQEGKGQILEAFFAVLKHDIHPESGLKGTIDHGKHQLKHLYKKKTSPHSGSKKNYYKYPWAILKFTLIDGSSIKVKFIDKLKEKGGSVVRFQEIGKAQVTPNHLLYRLQAKQSLHWRCDLSFNQADLKNNPQTLGYSLAEYLKSQYRQFPPRPPSERETVAPTPLKTSESKSPRAITRVKQLLKASELQNLSYEPLGQGLELRYQASGQKKPRTLWLEFGQDNQESYVSLRLPILGKAPSHEKLLRANPALAHGRFAYYLAPVSGKPQLCLFKTLLLATLDREELETAITGLSKLGGQLAEMQALPGKTRAYRAARNPDWERLLLENSLQNLEVSIEASDKKFKCRLALAEGRFQTVHVRFDRQDPDGNQMIALQSFCGAQNPDLYTMVLEENSQWSYGAVGLAQLGQTEMFVVSDNQLAQTADPPELRQAILHVAQKADTLEALLTGADLH